MRKAKTIHVSIAALLLVSLLLPAAAIAQEPEVLAEIENYGDGLVFYPVVEFHRMILTVTGPCDYQYRQVLKEGDEGVFKLDETTIDGPYSYNLSRNEKVDSGIVKILQEARLSNDAETPRALCRDGKLPGPPLAQAEGFLVLEGKIVYDHYEEEKAAGPNGVEDLLGALGDGSGADPFVKDFVINDDLIVDGSACIGFDCVDGESFGFDTIRVKENNLRIKFDDTSVAASYPRNDWQLTANDSANGGASKFSIDDISGNRMPFTVEANARSHSLYVDDGGRIGSRTSTPSVEIHTIDGDTPTLRLQQDGSSGFAPQTWDVAGNETNFFIRDVTNGSQLPFRIRPDAPTSSIFIDVNGDVGVGTSSPDTSVHVLRSGGDAQVKMEGSGGGTGFIVENTSASAADTWQVTHGNGGALSIDDTDAVDGAGGSQEMRIFNNGNVTISGALTTSGGTCGGGCDQVFQADFDLETIDEHAATMWEKSHLPAVGPTPENAPINLSEKTGRMLNELEKAHIYIEQLHKRLAAVEALLAAQATE